MSKSANIYEMNARISIKKNRKILQVVKIKNFPFSEEKTEAKV